MNKRSFFQIYSIFLTHFFVLKYFASVAKKVRNPNLTDEQKKIMFGEG